jgi:HD-like signal output (HDOD) protein
VLDIGLRQTEARACPGFNLEAIQEHGLLTARIARRLLDDKIQSQDAFSAAMLKDAGCLVLLSRKQEEFRAVVALAHSRSCAISEVETEAFGVSHAQVGAYLLGIWGLPYAIVEAVAHHHDPLRAGSTAFDVVGAVHVAGALAEECVSTDGPKGVGSGSRMDMGYLEHLGLQNHLSNWRAIAANEAAQLTRS